MNEEDMGKIKEFLLNANGKACVLWHSKVEKFGEGLLFFDENNNKELYIELTIEKSHCPNCEC